MRSISFPNGAAVAAIGQGTWHMGEGRTGEGRRSRAEEAAALRLGLDLGMNLIDTAEMYAEGGAEEVVRDAVAGRRDDAFIVSKVYPHNASRAGTAAACERSLKRLGVERIDLYLLHWRGSHPLAETVAAFELLHRDGKIGAWGVSNLDAAEMAELHSVPGGIACATDQVLYNPEARGIEFDLLPWCAARQMPVMAYSPVGQGGSLLRAPALAGIAKRHGVSAAQVAIAWALRHRHVIAIPKAGDLAHVRQNAAAGELALSDADFAAIDTAFAPPRRKQSLEML